jgi:rhodanese-related sulfurtransferase
MFNRHEYTVQEVADLLKLPQPPKLLDVRESPEWEQAHLPGTQPLTQQLLDEVIEGWDRAGPIVTICHRGVRSLSAVQFLSQQGFTNVRSMKGGVDAWARDIDPALPRY